jgi:hypothetical protein
MPRRVLTCGGRWRSRGAWLAAALCAACTPDATALQPFVERDSAGISILQNSSEEGDLPLYRVADEPRLVIGGSHRDDQVELYRVGRPRWLSDGGIMFTNFLDLLWFDADGSPRGRNGGQGGGPEELTGVAYLEVLPGDTVLVVNRNPPAIKRFGASGEFISSTPILLPAAAAGLARFADGNWTSLSFGWTEPPLQPGLYQEEWLLVWHPANFESADTLALMDGELLFGDRRSSVRVPGSPRAVMASNGTLVAAASTERYEIRLFDSTGTLQRVVRHSMSNPALTTEPPVDRPPARRPEGGMDRVLRPPVLEYGPAFDALYISSDNELWVRRGSTAAGQVWHIFDPAGRFDRVVQLPQQFRMTDVRGLNVLGVWRDEMDVESVTVLTLVPGQGSGR